MKRCFIFWLLCVSTCSHAADPVPLELWQTIIRAPEMEVLDLATDPTVTDAMLSRRLREAVRQGRARLLADVRGAVDELQSAEVSTGQHIWLPTELDQDFDRLYMTPTAFEEFLIGTSLTCRPEIMMSPEKSGTRIIADWHTRCSPRGPLNVKWPTSWLRVYEGDKPTGRAIHGWLDWRDLFEESVSTRMSFVPGLPKLIAILPPAEQLWPGEAGAGERQLDVILGGIGLADENGPLLPQERTLLLGIALSTGEALKVMAGRDHAEDAALLESLLGKVRGGTARLILSAGSGGASGGSRAILTSGRNHDYPTEMPSIPSAWEMRPVGTRWESDGSLVALQQDLAPPARTEWPLALDVPAAIMWEPRFRGIDITSTRGVTSGTRLLSLLQIPDVMRSPGLEADESVLIFVQHQAPPMPARVPAPGETFAPGNFEPTSPVEYEAEIFVFEVPGAEEADWQPGAFATAKDSDQSRLKTLLTRVGDGTATQAAHLLLRASQGERSACRVVEEYMTATEFDPPEEPNSPRMRPTALEMLPVGTQWEIDISDPGANATTVSLEHTFNHTTAKPVEPPLAETLAIARNDSHDYPGAVHHRETWEGGVTLKLNQAICLGVQKPPGVVKGVRHVAFMRVRKL